MVLPQKLSSLLWEKDNQYPFYLPYHKRADHPLKGCSSFRYRIICMYKNDRDEIINQFIHKKGYYYISGCGSPIGSALFTASFGDSIDGIFNYAQIYQYAPKKDLNLYKAQELYKSSDLLYVGGLYYHRINEGSVEMFRHEFYEYLTYQKKKFPHLL